MAAQRIKWIDTLKGIGIVFVFLGHTALITRRADHYIFSFHMPLFFFISGIFWKSAYGLMSFREFLLSEIKKRLVPYFSFGFLTYGLWLIPILLKQNGEYKGLQPVPDSLYLKPIVGMLYGIGSNVWLPHNAILWFLACLFVTEIFFFFIYRFRQPKFNLLLFLFIFSLIGQIEAVYSPIRMPFSLDIALIAVGFYGLGHWFKDHLIHHNANVYVAILCLALGIAIAFLNNRIDLNDSEYGNPLLFYVSCLSSIFAFICFAKQIPEINLISFIGKNSLSFFLLQSLGFFVINMLAYVLFGVRPNYGEPNLVYAFVYVFSSLIAIVPAVYLINKWFPIITGKF